VENLYIIKFKFECDFYATVSPMYAVRYFLLPLFTVMYQVV